MNVGANRSVLRSSVRLCGVRATAGGGRLLRRTCTALALGVAALLTLCAGAAQAEPPKLVSYGSFTAEGPGVAVDQSSGNVFTAGFVTCKNGCGFGGLIKQSDADGKLISTIGSASFYTGAAVNPTNKRLYVLDGFGNVGTYAPSTGEELSSFPVIPSGNFFGFLTAVQIATDSSGHLYVPVVRENEVLEYSEAGALLNTFKASGAGELKEPSGVAVDSVGDLWVADFGNNRIEELSPAGAPLGEIKSEGVTSVGLGQEGNIFASVLNSADVCGPLESPCVHLIEYSSAGTPLADLGAGELGVRGFSAGVWSSMVAVNGSSGRVYVSDVPKGIVWMFGPPKAPVVAKELVVDVKSTEAELGALVSAGGLPTSYRFEYGVSAAYGSVAPLRETQTAGVKMRSVWAPVDGLEPGTTYHYRLVAQNALGNVQGADQTFTTPAANGVCPNEALRSGLSASLPDCRAYEMVTQPNSAGAQPDSTKAIGIGKGPEFGTAFAGGGFTSNHAARNGDRFAYFAFEVMPGADSSGTEYVATRTAGGWSSEDVIPLQSYDDLVCSNQARGSGIQAFSSQLTAGVLRVGANEREGTSTSSLGSRGGCGTDGFEVVQGEPPGVENLLLRDDTGGYQLINTPPAGTIPTDAHFEGASADLSHVFVKENTRLTENGPAGVEGLYEWDEGRLQLVSELPDGVPVAGSLAARWSAHPSVVSADGTHVFFSAEGNLYLRIDGERTVQIDEPQGGSGVGGGGEFLGASSDGTQAYFADDASAGLTADTVAGSGANLYRYARGQLSDLTVGEQSEFVNMLGVGQEGVYFVARGVLSGSQSNQRGETAQPGQSNIYEWRSGTIIYIATVSLSAPATSPNGAFLAFVSTESPTGYDNTNYQPEIYLYSSASKELTCVSCNPSGEAPSADGALLTDIEKEDPGQGAPHAVSDDGRIVFQSREALLPGDTNGQMDIYEYEEGQLHLISSGTGGSDSLLLDTSEEGRDVFFLSRQPLVPQDTGGEGESKIIYDAREDGGFPALLSPPACLTADACRAPVTSQPSIYGAPSSQTFSGAGNLAPVVHKKVKPKPSTKKRCGKRLRAKKAKCVRRGSTRKAKKSSHRGGR